MIRVKAVRWNLLGCLTSASLYAASQPSLGVWPLAYLCLVPWLLTLRSGRTGAANGLLLGLLAGIACGWWLVPTLLGLGASLPSALAGLAMAALWAKALPLAAAGWILGAARGAPPVLRILLVPAVWCAIESLHSLPPWGLPWSLLGHSQAPVTGVAQLAVLGGVPWLSAVIALTNSVVAELLLESPTSRRGTAAAAAALGAGLAVLGLLATPLLERMRVGSHGQGGDLRLLALQPSIPSEERWIPEVQRTNLLASLDLARRELDRTAKKPSLLVFPEMLVTTPIERSPVLAADLGGFARAARLPVLLGVARAPHSTGRDRYRNTVLLVTAEGELRAGIEKELPVPWIEGEPRGLAGLLGWILGAAAAGPKAKAAEGRAGPLRIGDRSFAVVLCYEALFPSVVAARSEPGTAAVLHLANDSWPASEAATPQLLAADAFRAIETRLAVVRVAHGGTSAVFDAYGRRVAELGPGVWGSLAADLSPSPPPGLPEAAALLGLLLLGGAVGSLSALALSRRTRVMQLARSVGVALAALLAPTGGYAEETLATLRLDGLSYVSFEGRKTYALPSGSTIGFRLGTPLLGAVPFSIAPKDVSIAPIDLGGGATLTYSLAAPASGSFSRGEDGQVIVRLAASLAATVEGTDDPGTQTYALVFTTEAASARSLDGARSAEIQGMRLVESAGYVQLVGAATNKAEAYPEPGTAATAVLSGSFDPLPVLPSAAPAAR